VPDPVKTWSREAALCQRCLWYSESSPPAFSPSSKTFFE